MKRIYLLAAALAVLALIGCGSGGGGTATVVGSNTVGGAASKGPFQTGSTVTAYKLNTNGTRSATTATGTVSDNLGTYSLTGVSWAGMTEVVITGKYLDENTGNVSTADATMSAIINLPTIGAAVNSTTANPNIASTVAASVAKKTLAVTPATTTAAVDSALQSASQTTASALGLPTTDANGAAIDLSKLNVTSTADTNLGAANKQLLAVSATYLDAVTNGASTSITTLVTSLATDVNAGQALGTDSSSTAIIKTSQATVITNAATISSNLTTAVTSAGGTADTTLAANLAAAATTTSNTSAATLRGVAASGNTFTIGAVTYTIATTGAATAGAGTISASGVTLALTFKDYLNTAGNGAGAATTYATSFSFNLDATTGTRAVSGSISPVNVVTDGAGNVSITVPVSAVITYNGTDSAGLNVTGSTTNGTANIIQTSGTAVSIDANALLTTIQNKVGAGNAQLLILGTAGTFTFGFGIGGLNIGIENGGATGVSQLLPVGTTVSGRAVTGTLTTI